VANPGKNGQLHIAALTDDVYQLDRRITHQFDSLRQFEKDIRFTVLPTVTSLKPPATVAEDIAWGVDIGGQEVDPLALSFKGTVWKMADALGMNSILQVARCALRDPARRGVEQRASTLAIETPDLIMAHSLTVLPMAMSLRRRWGVPVIFDAHELFDEQREVMTSRWVRLYWRRVGDEFVPKADATLTVSERLADHLKARHHLGVRPAVVHNACPYEADLRSSGKLRALYGIGDTQRIILCQGGLLPQRGLEQLIDAAAFLSDDVAVVFLGTGDDSYVDSLRARIAAGGAKTYLGRSVEQDELLEHTADAALGIITNRGPGLNNTDGGPNRLFEYIQARVPILSYQHNGVDDILKRSKTGWCERWSDAPDFARLIEQKLQATDDLDAGVLNQAATELCWEKESEKFLDVYDRVMAKHRKGGN